MQGIDVPETEVAINFNVLCMSDDYVHRIGRKDAQTAAAWLTPGGPTDEVACHASWRAPSRWAPGDLELSMQVERVKTPPWEAKAMAHHRLPKRKADPTYKGAFHEKKKKKGGGRSSAKRRRRG